MGMMSSHQKIEKLYNIFIYMHMKNIKKLKWWGLWQAKDKDTHVKKKRRSNKTIGEMWVIIMSIYGGNHAFQNVVQMLEPHCWGSRPSRRHGKM